MSKNPRWKVWLAVLASIFVLGQIFFVPKVYVDSKILTALQAPFIFLRSVLVRDNISHQLIDLNLENQSLRAQIEVLKSQPQILDQGGVRYLRARVYSNYPTNNANFILVNSGEEDGVEVGMVGLVSPGIFLGEVIEVSSQVSVIRTVFDSEWELPVKIGARRVDALLISGTLPKLTLISKNSGIGVGAPVFLADKGYPYGLTVGSVSEVEVSDNERFDMALMKTPYDRAELEEVYIEIKL